MANYMFILRPTVKKYKVVCPECARRGEVLYACGHCHGIGVVGKRVEQYYVQDRPIEITHIDRNPRNGVLRYWENSSEFFYETITPALNKYVPEVPYGVHLCHDSMKSAQAECERINKYLKDSAEQTNNSIKETFSTGFNF
jgi:hypothetical protein